MKRHSAIHRAIHKTLVKEVTTAIENLFCDTRVSKEQTLEDMEEIQADVDSKIAALKQELKRGDRT